MRNIEVFQIIRKEYNCLERNGKHFEQFEASVLVDRFLF